MRRLSRIIARALDTIIDMPFWLLYGGAWLVAYILARVYMALRIGFEEGWHGTSSKN